MPIEFDYYLKSGALAGKEGYYVRAVSHQTVDEQLMAHDIEAGSAFSAHDVKGLLSAMAHWTAQQLLGNNHVRLAGLGTFSLSIEGRVETNKKGALRLKEGRVRTVKFLPDKRFMVNFVQVGFRLCDQGNYRTPQPSLSQAQQAAEKLLEEKGFFLASQFASQLGIRYHKAYRLLNQLVLDGMLHVEGTPRQKIYVK